MHDPRPERYLRSAVILGALAVLLVPAARGNSDWFGFLPLWLLGMPLSAWWALYRFRLPAAWRNRHAKPRKRGPQATRGRRSARRRLPQAA